MNQNKWRDAAAPRTKVPLSQIALARSALAGRATQSLNQWIALGKGGGAQAGPHLRNLEG